MRQSPRPPEGLIGANYCVFSPKTILYLLTVEGTRLTCTLIRSFVILFHVLLCNFLFILETFTDGYDPAYHGHRHTSKKASPKHSQVHLHDLRYGVGSSSRSCQVQKQVQHGPLPSEEICADRAQAYAGNRSAGDYGRTTRNEPRGGGRRVQHSSSPMSSCWFLLDSAQKHLDTVSFQTRASSLTVLEVSADRTYYSTVARNNSACSVRQ